MKTKPKQRKITVNGELELIVDSRGYVLSAFDRDAPAVVLTATDLDRMAKYSSAVVEFSNVVKKLAPKYSGPLVTRCGQYEICSDSDLDKAIDEALWSDGSIEIGCQNIDASDIRRVHRLSLLMRGRK